MDLTPQQAICHSLLYKQQFYKELTKPYRDQHKQLLEDEASEFRFDINKQYKSLIIGIIGNDITKNLAIPIEDVIVVLEELDIEGYLNT